MCRRRRRRKFLHRCDPARLTAAPGTKGKIRCERAAPRAAFQSHWPPMLPPDMRLLAVLLLLALTSPPPALAAPVFPSNAPTAFVQIDSSSRQFVDAGGRSLLFHGSSVVYKVGETCRVAAERCVTRPPRRRRLSSPI